jgi:hypothetical protein
MDSPALRRAFREDATRTAAPIILASSLAFPLGAPVLHNRFLQKRWKLLRCLPPS